MDYFTDILTTFLDIEYGSYISVYAGCRKALEFHQKYLYLCSEDERRPYGFHSTDVYVIGYDAQYCKSIRYKCDEFNKHFILFHISL